MIRSSRPTDFCWRRALILLAKVRAVHLQHLVPVHVLIEDTPAHQVTDGLLADADERAKSSLRHRLG